MTKARSDVFSKALRELKCKSALWSHPISLSGLESHGHSLLGRPVGLDPHPRVDRHCGKTRADGCPQGLSVSVDGPSGTRS